MIDRNAYERFRAYIKNEGPPSYSQEEQGALSGKATMTQEIFDRCVMRCAEEGKLEEFFALFERFPQWGEVWCAGLRQELTHMEGRLEATGQTVSPEVIQARWENFRNGVRILYGDEPADNLPTEVPDTHDE